MSNTDDDTDDDRPLRVFKLEADATFMARDLDHAFFVLGRHFLDLATLGGDAPCFFEAESTLAVHAMPEERKP